MILQIAWRNIWRNRSRSIIIIMSVAVGLLAGVAVMALYKGMLHSRVRTVIEMETGHIQLHAKGFATDYHPSLILPDGNDLLKKIQSVHGVRLAAPRSVTSGMLSTATGSAGVMVLGILPELEYNISQLKKKITDGSGFTKGKKNEIIIGKKLADKMKLKKGAKLVLTFTDTSDNIVAGAFRIAAIYQSENAPRDERNVYVLMSDLNALLITGSSFHEITLLLDRDEDTERMRDVLQKQFPGYVVESWKDISPETELMVNTMDEYSFIILCIIMLALAFGIINTMLMAILERTREIGMMVALGMNRRSLFLLILLETVFLTLAGAPLGLLTAWVLTSYYNKNGLDLSGLGEEMLSSFGYSRVVYPEFPWDGFTNILVIVTGTAVLSCLFPAIKALRLRPVQALQR